MADRSNPRSFSVAQTERRSRVAAQHSQDYSSWYSHIPGLIVIAPFDARREGLVESRDVIRTPSSSLSTKCSTATNSKFRTSKIGSSRSARPKSAAKARMPPITAHSRMVGLALKAADELAEQGPEAEVIDLCARCVRWIQRRSSRASKNQSHRHGGRSWADRAWQDAPPRHVGGVQDISTRRIIRSTRRSAVRRQPRSTGAPERRVDRCRESGDLPVIYRGACHCSGVGAEYETNDPVRLRQDGCSFCSARGVKSASDPAGRTCGSKASARSSAIASTSTSCP